MIEVMLTPFEHTTAGTVGLHRFNFRRESKDADWYDRNLMQDDVRASIAACVCEMAVAKALNMYWGAHYWHTIDHKKYEAIADVGTNVEVRRIRERTNEPAIRWRDVERERIVVAAYAEPPLFIRVEVLGWIPASEGWALGSPAKYDPETTRTLAPTHWRDPKDFTK